MNPDFIKHMYPNLCDVSMFCDLSSKLWGSSSKGWGGEWCLLTSRALEFLEEKHCVYCYTDLMRSDIVFCFENPKVEVRLNPSEIRARKDLLEYFLIKEYENKYNNKCYSDVLSNN